MDALTIPKVYTPPHGVPMHWANEKTGVFRAAITAYYEAADPAGTLVYLDANAFNLVREYVHYFLSAPCWTIQPLERTLILSAIASAETPEALARLVQKALDWGIDVL